MQGEERDLSSFSYPDGYWVDLRVSVYVRRAALIGKGVCGLGLDRTAWGPAQGVSHIQDVSVGMGGKRGPVVEAAVWRKSCLLRDLNWGLST